MSIHNNAIDVNHTHEIVIDISSDREDDSSYDSSEQGADRTEGVETDLAMMTGQ